MSHGILVFAMAAAVWAQSVRIDGNWQGVLGGSVRVGLHIAKSNTGDYIGTLDVIDQAKSGVPVQQMTLAGADLHFAVPSLNAKYDGSLNADATEITGILSDAAPVPGRTSVSRPLNFKRAAAVDTFNRMQNPQAPFAYNSVEVMYENTSDGVKLAATLTLPPGNGPFPAALIITGSGPQDRDETIAGHKPFLVIADYLTRRGIAVLRVDDRGAGSSTGDAATATLDDSVNDVLAGIQYLKTRREIDPKHIGVVGHSAGGRIGPLAASRSMDVRFVVMLAGAGITFEQNIFAQRDAILRAGGATEETIARDRAIAQMILNVLKSEQNGKAAADKVKAEWAGTKADFPMSVGKLEISDAYVERLLTGFNTAEVRSALNSDPAETLRRLTIPVLALNGSRDLQVPPQRNLSAIVAALSLGRNPDFTAAIIPGLNHMFQTCKDCSLDEYGKLDETFSPEVLEMMSAWLLHHVR